MKALRTFSILILLLFSISCSNSEKKSKRIELKKEIDTYLAGVMDLHNIPGLALAVIENDQVVYENYFGIASIEDSTSVNSNTLFRVFSTTKLVTTVGVFQLYEDGKLDLEDTISKYLDKLPVEWQQVKIKNLLSHSSGLPDIIRHESTLSDDELKEKLYQEEMEFVTGFKHSYNQTNYWLLAQIIEKITGSTFEGYILQNQFDTSLTGVLFSSNSLENIPNRATRYFYSDKNKVFEKDTNNNGTRGHSGNGLNITLNRFIEWDKKLKGNTLLERKTKHKMWTPFKFSNNFNVQKDNFLHGWGCYHVNDLDSYGFSGGNLSAYRFFPNDNTTIILMSNGYESPAFDIIVNDLARLIMSGSAYSSDLTLEDDIMRLLSNEQFDQATVSLKKLKTENPKSLFDNLKWNINGIANAYNWNDKPEKATRVYQLNAEAFPNWWIASSSLAEFYEERTDTVNAVKYYKQAILLNEKNEWNYNEEMKHKLIELENK